MEYKSAGKGWIYSAECGFGTLADLAGEEDEATRIFADTPTVYQ